MSADSATKPHRDLAAMNQRRRWQWRIVRVLRAAALAYLALLVLLLYAQDKIIFPGAMAPPPAVVAPIPGSEPFTLKSTDGSRLAGLFCRTTAAPAGRKPPTILYFYGNASQVAYSRLEIDLFRECGANVLVLDYPGYGTSTGRPSELSFYRAANALWDYAVARPEVDPRQIVLVGWSLGGAVATDLASRRPAAGLMVLSSFTSVDAMGRYQMPYLPTSLLLEHRFRSVRKLRDLRIPIAIAHGTRDTLVPFSMSQRLRDSVTFAPFLRYVPIEGAGHDDIFGIGHERLKSALQEVLTIAQRRTIGDASTVR